MEKTDRFVLHCKEFQCSFFLSHSSKNVFFSFLSGSVIAESEFGLMSLLGVILMCLENPSALSAGPQGVVRALHIPGCGLQQSQLCSPTIGTGIFTAQTFWSLCSWCVALLCVPDKLIAVKKHLSLFLNFCLSCSPSPGAQVIHPAHRNNGK